jgi:hypothetical protein
VKGNNVVEMITPAPAGFTVSREDWAKTPAVIRDEILRMEKEFAAGFEKYRPAAERDAALAEFHQMAESKGTTLKAALSRYTALENLLRAYPVKGLEAIFENLDMDPREWAQRVLAEPEAA